MSSKALDGRMTWIIAAQRILLWWAGLHVLGRLISLSLAAELGFYPIWFLDCVMCATSRFALPANWWQVGGVSIPALVAILVAVVFLRTRAWSPVLAAISVLAIGTHVIAATAAKVPGPLPNYLVSMLFPAAALMAMIMGIIGKSTLPIGDRTLDMGHWSAGLVGTASMATFGAWFLPQIAVWWGSYQAVRSRPGLGRRMAIVTVVFGILSWAGRWSILRRFPFDASWF